jgi:hypothetical protein
MRLIVAVTAAVLVLGGTAAAATTLMDGPVHITGTGGSGIALYVDPGVQPQTGLPADAIVTNGNVRLDAGELQYGGEATIQAGLSKGRIDYGVSDTSGQPQIEPRSDVIATIQSGGQHLQIASARVVGDRWVVIRLTSVAHAPVRIAYMLLVNH